MKIFTEIRQEIIEQSCCRIDIRNDKSLSFGLGDKCLHKKHPSCVQYYGFWEIGTYNASWRIVKNNKILFGSESDCDYNVELVKIEKLFNERLLDMKDLSLYDVSFYFSNNLRVDFFNCFSEDDEMLHILRDDGLWWEKRQDGTWKKGISIKHTINPN